MSEEEACLSAVLVTRGGEVGIHGRPMEIAEVDPDGTVWFISARSSPKVREVREHPDVELVCRKKESTLVLDGRAEIVVDRERIEALFRPEHRAWFPAGKDDPDLCLIAVHATRGEYWDGSGQNRLDLGAGSARAYLKGEGPRGEASPRG